MLILKVVDHKVHVTVLFIVIEVLVFLFLYPYLCVSSLVRTFLLVDGGAGLQKADLVALEMFQEFNLPFVVSVCLSCSYHDCPAGVDRVLYSFSNISA